MIKMRLLIIASLSFLSTSLLANEQDHIALREFKGHMLEALNNSDFITLEKLFHSNFTITFSDQSQFSSIENLKKYYNDLVNKTGIEKITFSAESDAKSIFLSPTVAVNRGSSIDQFLKNDGTELELKSRWTATMVKENDKWKLAALHSGINFLDNAYTEKITSFLKILIALSALIGFLLAFFIFRKKTSN